MTTVILLVNVFHSEGKSRYKAEVQQCVVICGAQEHDGIVSYHTVHCCLSENELYIYGHFPVRQCNSEMSGGSFNFSA